MAFFDKPIQFRNFQASATSDYHFRIYKTRDEDNMYMIELCDESNLKFIYRLRLTSRSEEKICNENGINPANGLIKYIQKFVNELSDKQWLTCEVSNEKHCNIHFYETVKNLGGKLILKLSLAVVENAEFQQYVMDTAEKYKRRYIDKKRENEGQRKKLESLEKKVEEMKSDVDEKYKLSKELRDMREDRERLDFKYEAENAELLQQSSVKDGVIQGLKNELENLNIASEMKDKIIEELNGMKTLPAPIENAQPSKPKVRPCALFNRTGPTFPLPNR
uniref:Spindle assembly abnormal protein 6 N-terminal domain-containing protein n=1 Tax=Panagrolaimus sp. ES5 TaxID=591445 RepID=A0AC34FDV5_9BILA